MKFEYTAPEIEIKVFAVSDVITVSDPETSGGLTNGGEYDGSDTHNAENIF